MSKSNSLILICILLLLNLCGCSAPMQDSCVPKTYRIMPIGDSITQGNYYRYPLFKKLTNAGYRFEYVGSQKTNSPVGPLSHEGYGGRNAEFVASVIKENFKKYPANIVLIHAGHNHFADEKPIQGILEATESIIKDVRSINPKVIVLLAQVIPSGKLPKYSYIPDLNQALEMLANKLNTSSQPVLIVNQADVFVWETDTSKKDKVHPNAQGGAKMADRWYEVLTQVMEKRGQNLSE